MRRLNLQSAVLHSPCAAKEAARRRIRCPLAAGIVSASMTRTHKQTRLREPRDRTTEMCTVDGENQELWLAFLVDAFVADVNTGERGDSIPGLTQRTIKRAQ